MGEDSTVGDFVSETEGLIERKGENGDVPSLGMVVIHVLKSVR